MEPRNQTPLTLLYPVASFIKVHLDKDTHKRSLFYRVVRQYSRAGFLLTFFLNYYSIARLRKTRVKVRTLLLTRSYDETEAVVKASVTGTCNLNIYDLMTCHRMFVPFILLKHVPHILTYKTRASKEYMD